MTGASVFLDTNVLLAVTDEGRTEHGAARAILERGPTAGTALYTSGQVLREYLAVATRPESVNGLGLPLPQALDNVAELAGRLRLLALRRLRPIRSVADQLLEPGDVLPGIGLAPLEVPDRGPGIIEPSLPDRLLLLERRVVCLEAIQPALSLR